VATRGHDFIGHFLQLIDTACRDGQFHAFSGQSLGNASANANAGASDKRCFVCELQVHDVSLLSVVAMNNTLT
jgi:hypothetical protein